VEFLYVKNIYKRNHREVLHRGLQKYWYINQSKETILIKMMKSIRQKNINIEIKWLSIVSYTTRPNIMFAVSTLSRFLHCIHEVY